MLVWWEKRLFLFANLMPTVLHIDLKFSLPERYYT